LELARAARDESDDDLRGGVNALGQPVTNAPIKVFDCLFGGVAEKTSP